MDGKTSVEGKRSWHHRIGKEFPPAFQIALFYITYVLAGGFGFGLALIPGVAIAFWPPAGIFVATLLVSSKYSWPWWILAACLAELTCNAIWFHNTIPLALVYFSANALVALTAASLILRFTDKPFRFESLEQVLAFVVLGAGIAPLVSATIISATDALLGKHPFWTAWPLVWLGDSTGLLVSAPLTLVALQAWRDRASISWLRAFEAAVLLTILLGISALAFKNYLPTPYLTLPPLLWMAARFQLTGAAVALALIAISEALFVVTSDGQLSGQSELMKQKVIGLQTFFGIAAVSCLVVAVLSLQHKRALHMITNTNAELERRVDERTVALQASERELAAMFAATDVGMAQSDPINRRLLRVNAAMSAITGFSEAELLAMNADDLNHPDDRARDQRAWRSLDGELGYAIEKRYMRKDGNSIWVHVAVNLIHDAERKPHRSAAIIFDVTARKLATEALEASERFSRGILEANPDCVKVMAPNGQIEFMNAHCQTQMEIDDFNRCAGSQWSSLWPEETRHVIIDALKVARNGGNTRFEAFCPTIKGTAKWWDVVVTPVLDTQGHCTRIVSVSRDITDRKRNEEQKALLSNELNHRVKNTLATMQSMASQTLRTSPNLAEAKIRFEARLMSLSKAHDVLTRENWDSAQLTDIVGRAIMPYRGSKDDRFIVGGPDVRVSSQMALAFAMTLHELCTNAMKYGALSKDKGTVTIVWSLIGANKARPILKFRWSEKGGPPVTPPSSRGFGTKLIERSLASDLGDNVKMTFAKTGLTCVIRALLDKAEVRTSLKQLKPVIEK